MFGQKKDLGLRTKEQRFPPLQPKKKAELIISNTDFLQRTKAKKEGFKNWQQAVRGIGSHQVSNSSSGSSSSVSNRSYTDSDEDYVRSRSLQVPGRGGWHQGPQSHSRSSSDSDTDEDSGDSVQTRGGWYLERQGQVPRRPRDNRSSISKTHGNYRSRRGASFPERKTRQSDPFDQTDPLRSFSRRNYPPGPSYNIPDGFSDRRGRQYEFPERRSFSASPERRLKGHSLPTKTHALRQYTNENDTRGSKGTSQVFDDREIVGNDDRLGYPNSIDYNSGDAMTELNRFKSKTNIDRYPRASPRPHTVKKKKVITIADTNDTTRLHYTTTISNKPFPKRQHDDEDDSETDTDGDDTDSTRPPKKTTFESEFDKPYSASRRLAKDLVTNKEIERAKFQALRDKIMKNRELARSSMKSGKNLILMDSLENGQDEDTMSTLGPRENKRKRFLEEEMQDLHHKIIPVEEKLFSLSDSPTQAYVLVLWKAIVSVFNIIGIVVGYIIYDQMFWFIESSEFEDANMLSLNTTKYILNSQKRTVHEVLHKDEGFDIFEKGFGSGRALGYSLICCHGLHLFATCLELAKLKSPKVKWINPLVITIVWCVIVAEYWKISLSYLIIPVKAQGSISEFIRAYTPVTKFNPVDYIYLLGKCCGFYGPEDFEIRSDMSVPNNTDGTLVSIMVPPVCCKMEVFKKTVDDLIKCSQSASPIHEEGCFQYLQRRLKSRVKLYTWTLFNVQLVDIVLISVCYVRFVSRIQKYHKLIDQLNDFETEMVLLLHEFPEKVFKRQKLGDIVEKEEKRRDRQRRDELEVEELNSNERNKTEMSETDVRPNSILSSLKMKGLNEALKTEEEKKQTHPSSEPKHYEHEKQKLNENVPDR